MHVMSATHIFTSAFTFTGISRNLLMDMLPCQLSLDPEKMVNDLIITPALCFTGDM